jgi:hypothetical protein
MLREGAPSHALRPQLTRAKRNRDCIPRPVCLMRASRRIPPIGGYGASLAPALARGGGNDVGRSQILPKRSGNSKPAFAAAS